MTIISYNHDVLFIHVPKCGGSSVEDAFQRHVRWGDFVVGSTREGEILHKQVFNRLYGITKHSTAAELKAVLGPQFAAMRVVAVVREPLKIVESYYRFSKTIHLWVASIISKRNPGMGSDAAKRHALELVGSGKLDGDEQFDVLQLLSGTIKTGVLSGSFEQFLGQVADSRWSNYLSSYLADKDGTLLAADILKLEEPESVEAYFRVLVGPDFKLGHENASVRTQTDWPAADRIRFHDLMAGEYDRFGYRFQR